MKGCKSNYLTAIKTEGSITVYAFPELKVDRDRWLSAVKRDDISEAFSKFEEKEFEMKDGKLKEKRKKKPHYFVCRKHWPTEMETFECRGKQKPIDPPSIFPSANSALVPCPPPVESKRPSKRALSSVRSVQPDQLGTFLANDHLMFDEILKKVNSHELVAFEIDRDTIGVQPRVFAPIPKFFMKIQRNLSFETFHHGTLCAVF